MPSSRRAFLHAAALSPLAAQHSSNSPLLPTVKLGKHQITRLILGSNPFYGYSHASRLLDAHMREWSTPFTISQALHAAVRSGLNTFQTGGLGRVVDDVDRFRAEGGQLNVFSIAKDEPERIVSELEPIGIAHHGEYTDIAFRERKMDTVREFTKRVRQTGVLVGVSTHKPEVIEYIEEHGWDVDYFMGCVYNRTRTPDEFKKILGEMPVPANEIYLEGDPARMYRVMKAARHTCLAFKVLAAGRLAANAETIEKAFRQAYESIKPQDCVIFGSYPRFKDETAENAAIVREILA